MTTSRRLFLQGLFSTSALVVAAMPAVAALREPFGSGGTWVAPTNVLRFTVRMNGAGGGGGVG